MLASIKLAINLLSNNNYNSARIQNRNKKKRKRHTEDKWFEEFIMVASKLKEKHIRINNYLNVVRKYSFDDFKTHFRLTRNTVEVLLHIIPKLEAQRRNTLHGRPNTPAEQLLLMTIWLLANQESFRGVADRFNMSRGHMHKHFLQIIKLIVSLKHVYIEWPTGNLAKTTINDFNKLRGPYGFPHIIGAVDGMHVPIPAPTNDAASYYNRKGFHSVLLQGTCNAHLKFIDCFVGWPGSSHDSRVWKNSPLYKMLSENENSIPNNCHLVGDSAYPLDTFIMVPYRDNGHLTRSQKKFNQLLMSSKRVVIEQAYGMLQARFRRLKYLNMLLISEVKNVILACCILHNLCINNEDYTDQYNEVTLENEITYGYGAEVVAQRALQKRDELCNFLNQR